MKGSRASALIVMTLLAMLLCGCTAKKPTEKTVIILEQTPAPTASVQAPASRAILAFTPSVMRVLKHSSARAMAAPPTLPPAQVEASERRQARASK